MFRAQAVPETGGRDGDALRTPDKIIKTEIINQYEIKNYILHKGKFVLKRKFKFHFTFEIISKILNTLSFELIGLPLNQFN